MKKLRWGVLSTAKIGRNQVIPAIQQSSLGEVVAIASRDIQKAEALLTPLNIQQAYGTYEAVLQDPNIDAIYNPLPNHLHLPLSLAAINAGKHVLCEKPIGLNADQAKELLTAAKNAPQLVVMEAFMYRFHPQWQLAKRWIEQGTIGRVRHVHSYFAYNNQEADNIRNVPEWGGGALMDIGCYCISLARYLLSDEPKRVLGQIIPCPDYAVDCFVSGMMEFSGALASFTASTKSEPEQYVDIHGERGQIRIPVPFNPTSNAATEIYLMQDGARTIHNIEPSNHYQAMTDAFAQAVFAKKPAPTPLKDAVANMQIIDAIFASAKQGQWINLEFQ